MQFGPWNPGVQSEVPAELLPLSTIFRSEHAARDAATVEEFHRLTGLPIEELALFRPERLVVHELLVRVTADLSVPDGPRVEDLGINFRRMVATILTRYIDPNIAEIVSEYHALQRTLATAVDRELAALFTPRGPVTAEATGVRERLQTLWRWAGATGEAEEPWARASRLAKRWAAEAQSGNAPERRAACAALSRVVCALLAQHGRLWGDAQFIARLAVGIACNEQGSELIGALIEPHIRRAAEREGYMLLPAQTQPVVMNTKGASASGKSTIRPLQRRLAGEIGVNWADFALISPDIWRKYLLDYGALGDAYRYAGAFTGRELAIIDRKLDRYMARKAERGDMSHLLIDRFRFDSFAPDSEEAGSNLLTRFGSLIYMFFMVTPPHETVERSWKRGLEVGRYKAVDDLLAHNIEAYAGMPQLFFTWALGEGKRVHYEFLDNSVPFGERPRSIAFGWNGEMNVLDVKCMLDIDRYRKINVNARGPAEVYPDRGTMAPENNTQFLVQCARLLPAINFAFQKSGRIYARLEGGKLAWCDPAEASRAMQDPETRAGLLAVAPRIAQAITAAEPATVETRMVRRDHFHTLGQWGGNR